MDRKIEISVIVVTYNQEDTIARTLDSILAQQTDVPFEIVIGDDCSTDNTESVCRDYAERYPDIIRYFRREKNLGIVGNYFQCIADSRGRFLADCAGDDYWVNPDKLQMEYDVLAGDEEVALVHTDWRCCDITGENIREPDIFKGIERSKREVYSPGELTPKIINHDPRGMIHLCTAMFRKDIITEELRNARQLLISPEYGCEDYQIEIVMSVRGKIVYLPVVTLHYSIYDGSISHTHDCVKEYRRVKGNLLISERLREYYNVDIKEIIPYYVEQLDYLSAQAFHSRSKVIADDYKTLRKTLFKDLKVNFKTRVKEFLIRIGFY
ncbi:MAG: glycosyltransferase [Muribaculaceae bacterium]|nr:glycosyltransferase [Muribaculaceae bacterium]